jgi:hypothetical protein
MWKNVVEATDDLAYDTAHELCMLDYYVYRWILRICDIYCFSAVTMVKGTRINVAFLVKYNLIFDFKG